MLPTLTILAAASLTNVLPALYDAWPSSASVKVSFQFDASPRLARQIEQGLRADAIITADDAWMDYLRDKKQLKDGSRRVIARNALVVVVPAASALKLEKAADLVAPAIKRLALAGETVPAGKYAKAALEQAKTWPAVETRVVRGDSVRSALRLAASGEADAAVVYASDAAAEPKVRTAFAFPSGSHPPIVYPGAVLVTSRSPDAARAFLDYCDSAAASSVWEGAGFPPTSRR